MIVRFVPEARSELHDGASYYEGELSGLGLRFWEEVDQHIAWIADNAEVPRLRPDRSWNNSAASAMPWSRRKATACCPCIHLQLHGESPLIGSAKKALLS
jgi:hypothetical protein